MFSRSSSQVSSNGAHPPGAKVGQVDGIEHIEVDFAKIGNDHETLRLDNIQEARNPAREV